VKFQLFQVPSQLTRRRREPRPLRSILSALSVSYYPPSYHPVEPGKEAKLGRSRPRQCDRDHTSRVQDALLQARLTRIDRTLTARQDFLGASGQIDKKRLMSKADRRFTLPHSEYRSSRACSLMLKGRYLPCERGPTDGGNRRYAVAAGRSSE
jgi:hypothetical protein